MASWDPRSPPPPHAQRVLVKGLCCCYAFSRNACEGPLRGNGWLSSLPTPCSLPLSPSVLGLVASSTKGSGPLAKDDMPNACCDYDKLISSQLGNLWLDLDDGDASESERMLGGAVGRFAPIAPRQEAQF